MVCFKYVCVKKVKIKNISVQGFPKHLKNSFSGENLIGDKKRT